ncbi:hypothetical protein CXB51_003311 [Gossypium anomalum]|uniref:Uncharacterized protein n=1 Tax=Gossypium anomalum TaxID=47600 RepID=A0A8J5Z5T9_9ROSI|nr:hypothetical protein CXB51_003311 [Gossypium anomalum]
MLRYQWEDAVRFWNSKKGEEKLKDKRAEYEAIALSDSFVNLDDIDNRITIEVLSPERYGRLAAIHALANKAQVEVKRLRDQMAQMQASTVEQIAQLKAKATSKEAKAQRKYDELQLQLKVEAATREVEATRKYEELQLQLQNMMKMFQQS